MELAATLTRLLAISARHFDLTAADLPSGRPARQPVEDRGDTAFHKSAHYLAAFPVLATGGETQCCG